MKTIIFLFSLLSFTILSKASNANDPFPINAILVSTKEDQYECPEGYSYLTIEDNHAYSPYDYPFVSDFPLSMENQVVAEGEIVSEGETESSTPIFLPCYLLDPYAIARISGGGSQDGYQYGCKDRTFDSRSLGDAICIQYIWDEVDIYQFGKCPKDTTVVSLREVLSNVDKYCGLIGELETVIIGDGATLSGRAYDCQVDLGIRPIFSSVLCGKSTLNDFRKVPVDETACGENKTLTTVDEINAHLSHFCGILKDGEAARLSGGATLRKTELECVVFENDRRPVRLAFCGPAGRDSENI